jgi:hypothetical protein
MGCNSLSIHIQALGHGRTLRPGDCAYFKPQHGVHYGMDGGFVAGTLSCMICNGGLELTAERLTAWARIFGDRC